jgi:hypothetical protein
MKRSKLKKIESTEPSDQNEENELSGYIGLEMKRPALALARKILLRPKLTGKVFEDCFNAVERFARSPRQWRELLVAAYERLDGDNCENARFRMLVFFDSHIKDPAATLLYTPKRITRSTGIVETLLVWCCWLQLGKMDKLAAAVPAMSYAIRSADYPCMRKFLADAYARYWAIRAELESEQADERLVNNVTKQLAVESETEVSQLLLKGITPKNPRR